MPSLSVRLCLAVNVICLLIPSSLMASFPKPLPKFPVGPSPEGVAVGDFNGDGKLDLVVVNQDHFTITVVLGRGDGTFRSPISSTDTCVAAATGPVFVGDFNGDLAAGLKGLRFHDLRHTFITMMAERGVPLPVVQSMVGHMTAAITKRYTHISTNAARLAVELLDGIRPEFADVLADVKLGAGPKLLN